MARAVVVVLDSFGIGSAPDAARFNDTGADTYGHIARWCAQQGRALRVPNLLRLGLGHAHRSATGQWAEGVGEPGTVVGAWAAAASVSAGKDTPSGHWELMGCPVAREWGTFAARAPGESIFPAALMQRWLADCGLGGSLGNCLGSGTEIITQYGDEHVRTGWPICYSSADSVFQVAAHEVHFGLERLLDICARAKPVFDEVNIARVIARPFTGASGAYRRTANRRDLTTPPPTDTLLDRLVQAGRVVHAVGKIDDIFASRGTSRIYKAPDNAALCRATRQALADCPDGGLVFSNLVDFDMLFGHRRDIAGYADALEAFDQFLPELMGDLIDGDLLVLTADHGCDPTWPGSDHTREFVPLLFGGPACPAGHDAGRRATFADLGQTLARHLGLAALPAGTPCWG